MSTFDFLDQYEVTDATRAEFVFHEIQGLDGTGIVLDVAPAGEPNPLYFNALSSFAMKRSRSLKSGDGAVVIKQVRDLDRKLYPQHVIKGWKNMPDTGGTEVPYSKKSAAEFLSKLPDHYFDKLREFCADLDNFANVSLEDAEATAKNSQSGSSGN